MSNQNQPMLCNPETGICEIPNATPETESTVNAKSVIKPILVIYFTDPICSSCWGIEPQLRKLKLEYGNSIDIEYKMGGLLPDWSYNSGGISKPSDVAHHWDEVSPYYDMPIDGDIWLEDPLDSSYPPSIAFEAAQMQDYNKAQLFLREIREMVFLYKKNITHWEHLENAARKVGLDPLQMKKDANGEAVELFKKDLQLGREMQVRGFPSLFFVNSEGKSATLYGAQSYTAFEEMLLSLVPSVQKQNYQRNWEALFERYPTLTAREFSELSAVDRMESEKLLNTLHNEGKLDKFTTKNGAIWRVKPNQ